MIDVNSLRIGSIVAGRKGYRVISELRETFFTDHNGVSILYRDTKPLILTERLLIRSGLKGNSDNSIFSLLGGWDDNALTLRNYNGKWHLYLGDEWLLPELIKPIEHYHHLQNIVKDLSGIELTLK